MRWIGKAGVKDWDLMPVIFGGDWTFVTRNAYDFRGSPKTPGSKGEYATVELHAGLICLNGPAGGFTLYTQLELFEIARDQLERDPDLTNQVLEVTLEGGDDAEIAVRRYGLPKG
ncbi:MAG TPA: toxin-antitoxin system, toxin component, PIN family protein [Phenylobacterium sp.]